MTKNPKKSAHPVSFVHYKPQPMRFITRVNQPSKNNYCWYVRIPKMGISTTFADGIFGGKRQALEHAQKFRDVQVAHMSESDQLRASKVRKKAKKVVKKGGK